MLDLFRKRGVMSVIYSALMGAVIVVFVVQFRPNANSPVSGLTQKCVAKVRGTCIDEREWRAQRYLLRGEYDSPGMNWNKAAVDSLVERTLLEHEAKRIGVRVTEDDVMNELIRWRVHVTLPAAMRAQGRQMRVDPLGVRWVQFGTKEKPFDQQIFDKVVQGLTGQNPSEFVDAQAQELVASRMIGLVAERVRVSDVEAFEQYKHDRSTTTLQYVKLDPRFFAEHFVPVDRAAIEKWAAEHKGEVDQTESKLPKEQEKRLLRARQILVESKKDDPADKKAEAKKKAEDLLAQVKKGEDFAKLAKDSSADLTTKDRGGEWGWTPGYEHDAPLKDALGKAKAGDAFVVESDKGFHVVQLVDRLDGTAAVAFPLYRDQKGEELAKQAADKIAAAAKGQLPVKVDDALKAKIEEQKKAGKTEADATAQVVSDEAKARMQKAIDDALAGFPAVQDSAWQKDDRKPRVDESSPYVAGGSPIAGVADPTAVLEAADKLTKDAPLAGPLKAGDAHYVLALKDRHESTREEFEKEKAMYVGQLLTKKREDAIMNYLTGLREAHAKEITVEQRYAESDKKAAGEGGPPPMPLDEP